MVAVAGAAEVTQAAERTSPRHAVVLDTSQRAAPRREHLRKGSPRNEARCRVAHLFPSTPQLRHKQIRAKFSANCCVNNGLGHGLVSPM